MKELEEKDRTIQNSVQRVAYRKSKQGIDAIQYIHRDRKSFVFFFFFSGESRVNLFYALVF